jgi:hypothetical protein
MKKSISKLALKHEVIKTLVDSDLSRVAGGGSPLCGPTKLVSTCTTAFHADSLQHPRG